MPTLLASDELTTEASRGRRKAIQLAHFSWIFTFSADDNRRRLDFERSSVECLGFMLTLSIVDR
ncbi:MAG: hypothetical protein ACQESR_26525 [Planctomycetota bacterium]